MKSEQILNQMLDQAQVTDHILQEKHVKDKVGTKSGLCTVEVQSSIYGTSYLIGPVIGPKGQPLKERKYFAFKYFLNCCLYLEECINT